MDLLRSSRHWCLFNRSAGNQIPIGSTPTLWVTGKGKSQPVTWPINYALFKQYIDTLLK